MTIYSLVQIFEGLNFTNLPNPRNSRNLSTSKKTNYTVLILVNSYDVSCTCKKDLSAIDCNYYNEFLYLFVP